MRVAMRALNSRGFGALALFGAIMVAYLMGRRNAGVASRGNCASAGERDRERWSYMERGNIRGTSEARGVLFFIVTPLWGFMGFFLWLLSSIYYGNDEESAFAEVMNVPAAMIGAGWEAWLGWTTLVLMTAGLAPLTFTAIFNRAWNMTREAMVALLVGGLIYAFGLLLWFTIEMIRRGGA